MKAASFCNSSFDKARSGEMSSMIQMPRPCVARIRSCSRGWTWISRTAALGKSPPLNSAQLLPASREIQRPNSVPTKSSERETTSSRTTCA